MRSETMRAIIVGMVIGAAAVLVPAAFNLRAVNEELGYCIQLLDPNVTAVPVEATK